MSTDESGNVFTITRVVNSPSGGSGQSSANDSDNGFFDNTGAVAGTFVVVGLAITAGIIAFVFFMLRRRRRQRLDRDVAAAASAAAAASHHRGFDDEEEKGVQMTRYSGGFAGTDFHGQPMENSVQYDYEDPAGGYDHYASTLPMPGDRVSTATAPGLAGFGAVSAQDRYFQEHGQPQYEGYTDNPNYTEDMGYSAITRAGGQQQNEGYYFDPAQAAAYDVPTQDYNGHEEVLAHGVDEYPMGPTRTYSSGSLVPAEQHDERGGLKVTNV